MLEGVYISKTYFSIEKEYLVAVMDYPNIPVLRKVSTSASSTGITSDTSKAFSSFLYLKVSFKL